MLMYDHHLLHMYQAWQQGMDDYVLRWRDFVKFSAMHNNISADEMESFLKQTKWFRWINN
jgi:hypothetical protein